MLIVNGETNPFLLELVGIRFPRLDLLDLSHFREPIKLNDFLQKYWVNWVKPSGEFFRTLLDERFPREEEMVLLRRLGASAIPIDFRKKYNGTLLLGAKLKAVTHRMKFMFDEELDPQKRFRQQSMPQPVYFLGSTRALDSKQEMPEHVPAILQKTGAQFIERYDDDVVLGKWPTTEIEMMVRVHQWMWLATNASASWVTHVICAPPWWASDDKARPANTAETVKEWLEVADPGHYLVVSSQPFCENQIMAVRRAVKDANELSHTFDVCGPEALPMPLSIWLDILAKQLWEEVQLLQAK